MTTLRNRPNAEGAGALLGSAAADQLSAAGRRGDDGRMLYGYQTQQATIVAYHLMRRGDIEPVVLVQDLLEFAYSSEGPNVYRRHPEWFRAFLAAAREGERANGATGAGAAARTLPIGLWRRWEPAGLVRDAAAAAVISHSGAASVLAACTYAGAVAAASFGQHGRDFINGVHELAGKARQFIDAELSDLITDSAGADLFVEAVGRAGNLIGGDAADVVGAATEDAGDEGLVIASLVLGAVGWEESEQAIQDAILAPTKPSVVATLVGGIVGARRGLAQWPWGTAHEHWFAELGSRMVAQARTYEDLPDPYAVELHLTDEEAAGAPHHF
jgi:ADP-ribosylglycohydrolase